MDDIRFENRFVRGRETAKQIYDYWFYRQPLYMTLHIIMAFCFLWSMGFLLIGVMNFGMLFVEDINNILLTLLFVVVFEFLIALSCRAQMKAMVSRDAESFGGEPLCNIEISDTDITHSAKETRNTLPLSKVKSAFATKDYIVLVSEARVMYILKKDSFILGGPESFAAFLKEKNIKIKGKI